MKTKPIAFAILSFSALWTNGCATQADLQSEQRARDAIRTQLADNRAAMDSVRAEIEKVRGQVEELRYRVDRLAKGRQTVSPQVRTLEDRVAALERLRDRQNEQPFTLSPPATGEQAIPGQAPSPYSTANSLPTQPPGVVVAPEYALAPSPSGPSASPLRTASCCPISTCTDTA